MAKGKIKIFVSTFVVIIFLILVFNFVLNYVLLASIARQKLIQVPRTQVNDPKVILFWFKFFENRKWSMPEETNGEDYLKSLNCPVTNCILTVDKNYLKEVHLYDAIVFHGAEVWYELELPKTRSPHQFYVFASFESPTEVRHNLKLDHDFYNLTMTYRLDSDIFWAYGKFIEISTGNIVSPSTDVWWRQPEYSEDKEINSLLANKTKTAVWFVSHCNAVSKRDELAQQLQKYIDVDIYGKCGSKICSKSEQGKCNEMLNSTYKFYFSFENSLCADYVTEKLFNVMKANIVPVVFNGAEMSQFVPPHSVINANDFENVEDLGNYLKLLSENPEEYQKYFWWKKYYKVLDEPSRNGFCNLCKKMNEININLKKQVYENIFAWWYERTCDEKSKIKLD